jgi:hypothetical protein
MGSTQGKRTYQGYYNNEGATEAKLAHNVLRKGDYQADV